MLGEPQMPNMEEQAVRRQELVKKHYGLTETREELLEQMQRLNPEDEEGRMVLQEKLEVRDVFDEQEKMKEEVRNLKLD